MNFSLRQRFGKLARFVRMFWRHYSDLAGIIMYTCCEALKLANPFIVWVSLQNQIWSVEKLHWKLTLFMCENA